MAITIAAIASGSIVWQLAELILTGVFIVFLALWFLAIACVVMAQVVKFASRHRQAATIAPSAVEELSDETLVVIAAAVEAVLAKPAKILSIQSRGTEDRSWALAGRMQHHDSHAVRQRSQR